MSTLAEIADERVTNVKVTEDELTVRLMDGRTISVPLVWYPRLLNANAEQRKNWRVIGGGYGIHWEDIDEDLSTEGLLRGVPASQPAPVRAAELIDKNHEESDEGIHEKGVLDYFVEVEEASNNLLSLLLDIASQIEDIAAKVVKRTKSLSDMAEAITGVKASDVNNVFLLLAAEMTDFSKGIEKTTPQFKENTQTLEENFSVYVSLAEPENSENMEQLRVLKEMLSALLGSTHTSKESIGKFKDEVESVRSKRFSYAMNKATSRQAMALDGLITNIEEFESFALRVMFQINEKLGQP